MPLLSLTKKICLAALAFAIAFYFIIIFKDWMGTQQGYFSFIGDWESTALVLIIGFVIVKIIEWLLKLEILVLFAPRKKQNAPARHYRR